MASSCGQGAICAMRWLAKVWIMLSSAATTSGRERMVSSGRPSGGAGGGSGSAPVIGQLVLREAAEDDFERAHGGAHRGFGGEDARLPAVASWAWPMHEFVAWRSEPASKRVWVMRKVSRWRSSELAVEVELQLLLDHREVGAGGLGGDLAAGQLVGRLRRPEAGGRGLDRGVEVAHDVDVVGAGDANE